MIVFKPCFVWKVLEKNFVFEGLSAPTLYNTFHKYQHILHLL